MATEFYADDFGGEGDDFFGGSMPAPGRYHALCINARESEDNADIIEITFEVLAGQPPGQQGRRYTEFAHLTGKDDAKTKNARRRVMGIATRLGVITQADLAKARAAGTGLTIDWSRAVNAQCIIVLESNTYVDRNGNSKTNVKMPWEGIFDVNDPTHRDVPVDNRFAKRPPAPMPSETIGTRRPSGSAAPAMPPMPAAPMPNAAFDDI